LLATCNNCKIIDLREILAFGFNLQTFLQYTKNDLNEHETNERYESFHSLNTRKANESSTCWRPFDPRPNTIKSWYGRGDDDGIGFDCITQEFHCFLIVSR